MPFSQQNFWYLDEKKMSQKNEDIYCEISQQQSQQQLLGVHIFRLFRSQMPSLLKSFQTSATILLACDKQETKSQWVNYINTLMHTALNCNRKWRCFRCWEANNTYKVLESFPLDKVGRGNEARHWSQEQAKYHSEWVPQSMEIRYAHC